MNFETVIEKLRNNEPFHLSRWGDGEFLCMLGKEGKNCDGHDYTPILSEELNRVWADIEECEPNQFHLVQPHALRTVEGIENFLNGRKFDSSDLFVKASQKGELGKLFAALKDKYVILVAPKRFEDWDLFEVSNHIVIPDKNCFDSFEQTRDEVHNALLRNYEMGKTLVVLYCAGMMSNCIIGHQAKNVFHIDLGSVLEPYIGHANRKYHTEIIEKLKS
jgi:hypothetical protein